MISPHEFGPCVFEEAGRREVIAASRNRFGLHGPNASLIWTSNEYQAIGDSDEQIRAIFIRSIA